METVSFVWMIICSILFFFTLLHPISNFLASLFRKEFPKTATKQHDIAVLITAYKNCAYASDLIYSILDQKYNAFHVYVICDQCHDSDELRKKNFGPNVSIVDTDTPLNSKAKSMQFFYRNMLREHDSVLVFDPDNFAAKGMMAELNNYFQAGYSAIQGQRKAKNTASFVAQLEAANELYYNYIEREVCFKLGTSAPISGSGQLLSMELYKQYMELPEMQPERGLIIAEDKILQFFLVSKGVQIAYAEKAIVLDAKVNKLEQLERQRSRWIKSYFLYVLKSLKLFFRGLIQFNLNKTLFALFFVHPPLFILVLGAGFLGLLNLVFFNSSLGLSLIAALCIFVFNFFIVMEQVKAPKAIKKSLLKAPLFILRQILSFRHFLKLKKDFLVTKHD